MRRTLHVLRLALLAAALATPALAQKGVHKDPRIGFELKPPKDWVQVPLEAGEEWLVAKYQSDREDQIYDKSTGATWTMKPRLVVVAFLDAVIRRADVQTDEDEGEKKEVRVRVGPVFQDYPQYAEFYYKTNYGAGYYEAEVEEATSNGLPVRCLELRCETTGGQALRAVAWVFETDLGKVAVQLECFEDKFDRYEKDFLKVVKSFRAVERTASLDLDGATGNFISLVALGDLSPQDRRQRRQEQERQEWSKMTAAAPAGWKASDVDGVHVLNHSDERHAAKVVELIKATRAWLEDTFPQVGPDEYARMPIVRICANRDERNMLLSGTVFLAGATLTTYKDTDLGADSDEWGKIAARTMQMWFLDKDQALWIYMPAWLQSGLVDVLQSSSAKGKRLDFNSDWWDQYLKERLRSEGEVEPIPARTLLTVRDKDFAEGSWRLDYDAMRLVRLLVSTRSKKHRQVLPDYLATLKTVLGEIQAEDKEQDKDRPKPKTEEEEEAYLKEQQKRASEKEGRLLGEVLSRTFASWSEGDWKDLEAELAKNK